MKHSFSLVLAIFMARPCLGAQVITQTPPQPANSVPIFQVTVVSRTIKAINYRHLGATTLVDFRSTGLLPKAAGDAEVQSKEGAIQVNARFKHLQHASTFGPEYMTYVLWAISPEGRPLNLGEVLPDHSGNATLNVTSDLQTFGMIVTAEPHFAVTQPSDVVVLENSVTHRTNGTVEQVDAKFELLKRGQYILNVNPSEVTPIVVDEKTPLEIYEARNAIRIAKWAGAATYAPDSLDKAESDLEIAEDLNIDKGNPKDMISNAREAAQMAEDAREITIRKMIAQEQEQNRENEAAARAAAARAEAKAQADAQAAEQSRQEAELAEQAQVRADAAKQAAEAQAQQAQLKEAQAEKDKAALRAKLLEQLNTALQTRDSARGLIMSMSDVLFESGKYTLKPEAREKLAKVSGILLAYPGLTIEVDGYTDNVGSDEYNQVLSEERALAVRNYLTSQGVPGDSITFKGFGKANPIASNDTPRGRQQNRRVELVVSGDAIKSQINSQMAGMTSESH